MSRRYGKYGIMGGAAEKGVGLARKAKWVGDLKKKGSQGYIIVNAMDKKRRRSSG